MGLQPHPLAWQARAAVWQHPLQLPALHRQRLPPLQPLPLPWLQRQWRQLPLLLPLLWRQRVGERGAVPPPCPWLPPHCP